MAAKEPYDYLTITTSDVDVTLTIKAQGKTSEQSRENTVIHIGDDESEERIILSSTPVFYLSWTWNALDESDSGTILDLYHTSAQGMGKSFKVIHAGHTYVARFNMVLDRSAQKPSLQTISGVSLKLLGVIADA